MAEKAIVWIDGDGNLERTFVNEISEIGVPFDGFGIPMELYAVEVDGELDFDLDMYVVFYEDYQTQPLTDVPEVGGLVDDDGEDIQADGLGKLRKVR